jgi:hypothetical protein
MNKALIVAVAVMSATAAHADDAKKPAEAGKYFYVYHDKGDRQNHFIPAGMDG